LEHEVGIVPELQELGVVSGGVVGAVGLFVKVHQALEDVSASEHVFRVLPGGGRGSEWDLWRRGSAIRRAGYAGLRRNVAVAIGNWLA
jgi:hypothetical protein